MVICNPHGDKRKRSGVAAKNPEKLCYKPEKYALPFEVEMLFGKYYNNASRFAEDLCSSNDTQEVARLIDMVHGLHHVKHSIKEWLDFEWQRENFFTIVNERAANISMDDQVDAAMLWLYERVHFESPEAFQNRARFAQSTKVPLGGHLHTSATMKKDLSPEATRCMAELFRVDYELLRDLKDTLCKTEDCLRGINSILARRSFLFSKSE